MALPRRASAFRASTAAAVIVLFGACALPTVGRAAAVPQIECRPLTAPPDTTQQVLAPRVIINGRLLSIIGAHSTLSPAAFTQFYKTLWQGTPGRPLYVENTVGKWDVVAHKDGQCFYTVQVQASPGGGTGALLGIGALGEHFGIGALQFPTPGDARPLTHMVSDDSGTAGDTWLLYSTNRPSAVVAWFQHNLPALGWHADMPTGSETGNGKVLMYSKGHAHAGIVVAPFKTGAVITLTVMRR